MKHKISLTLDSDVLRNLKEQAVKKGCSMSHEANRILKEEGKE